MQRYVMARLALLVPTLLGITMVVSIAVRFLPGNVVDQILASYSGSPQARAQLEKDYGLNRPPVNAYLSWVGGVLHGNFGKSLISGRPISQDLKQRLPVTLELGITVLLLSLLIALPIGVLAAVRQNSIADYLARSLAIGFIAVPSFWLALLAITYGYAWFHWTPPLRYESLLKHPAQNVRIMWVPAIILGAGLSGGVMRVLRTTLLEVMRQDYVRTAWAKGLPEHRIIIRHGLRNAILPVVTVVGLQVPLVVGGTVILESIFALPGMGNYLLTAVQQRDYPVVEAVVLIAAVVVVGSNFLVDMSYSIIDPRIRRGS